MAYVSTQEEKDLRAQEQKHAAAASTLNYDKNNAYATDAADAYARLKNYKPFEYDAASDPLYQQYSQRYAQQGKLAMQDTMGQAAAMTGGYGNSYAQTVGQQTYNQYMSALADKIPELYELAYSQWQNEKNDLYNLHSIAAAQDGTLYDRATAEQSNNWAAANYYGSRADSAYSRGYGEYRDNVADKQYADQLAYQKEQDAIANKLASGYAYDANGNLTYVGSGTQANTMSVDDYLTLTSELEMIAEEQGDDALGKYLESLGAAGIIDEKTFASLYNQLKGRKTSSGAVTPTTEQKQFTLPDWTKYVPYVGMSKEKVEDAINSFIQKYS